MVLQADHVSKRFGRTEVLADVSLKVAAGEGVALVGESGCGKSTLIHILAGLEAADAGTVALDGQSLDTATERQRAAIRRRDIGIVFQHFNLIPSLSAGDNLRFQAQLAGRFDVNWAEHLERALGLTDHLAKYPEELSGGQQQRVAIGRALAGRPKLILADEPTGNLDEKSADSTISLMLELVDETDAALVVATHSSRVAGRLARLATLSKGHLT